MMNLITTVFRSAGAIGFQPVKCILCKLEARTHVAAPLVFALALLAASSAFAQSVCLPAPRLLTTMPMGGQAGATVEVTITGDNLDDAETLSFSHPKITAKRKLDANGSPVANKYLVSIAKDCPAGVHEARVMTRLGVSSSRVFSVGTLAEATRAKPNTSLATAMPLEVNSTCNAVMTTRAIDYYSFAARKGQRIIVDCAARGIDSKLKPVLIVGDDKGADLMVERRGGALDFTAPRDGSFTVKVHDLTYAGGPYYFYRLAIREAKKDEPLVRLPSTSRVSAFSWPPDGLPQAAATREAEPNNKPGEAQQITLPADIAGSFYPAADVDTFEFTAKKGETWWVEIASERFGLDTDPSVVVQHVAREGGVEKVTDLAEISDIPSPVKVSSNGYSYDGPPYNAGSTDALGKVVIQQDGLHRIQVRDLFGGTRNDPRNVYRLVVRRAAPDFAVVGWALHMNLRNGDRNALSKPVALRGGATMPIEVVVFRRDGHGEEITMQLDNLPPGVTAAGLRIPAGQNRGILLITAEADAPRGLTSAQFTAASNRDGKPVTHTGRFASMKWPVPDANREIPAPRLLADIPVSVSEAENSPITIAAAEDKVYEAVAGGKLTIPLVHARRCEFSGANISLKTYGAGFERTPAFDAPLTADNSEASLDLAKLKTKPGEYTIAFYGSAVAKYRNNPGSVDVARLAVEAAKKEAAALAEEAKRLAEVAKTAPAELKADAQKQAQQANANKQSADASVKAAEARLRAATSKAQPRDIVDIVVSKPIRIRVKPAEKK